MVEYEIEDNFGSALTRSFIFFRRMQVRSISMIEDYANKVMDYEYNAFMTAMNVSVSKHLFDEHFTVLWANDYFYKLIGYTKEEYEALFHNHVDEYYKDDPASISLMAQIILNAFEKQEAGSFINTCNAPSAIPCNSFTEDSSFIYPL